MSPVSVPGLIGATAASQLLGIQPSHISRYRDNGRLRVIPVEGTRSGVYVKAEVVKLAEELAEERKERARRREAREDG